MKTKLVIIICKGYPRGGKMYDARDSMYFFYVLQVHETEGSGLTGTIWCEGHGRGPRVLITNISGPNQTTRFDGSDGVAFDYTIYLAQFKTSSDTTQPQMWSCGMQALTMPTTLGGMLLSYADRRSRRSSCRLDNWLPECHICFSETVPRLFYYGRADGPPSRP